jgi:UDP-GlcNAc:undecaprenyl-phosphate/decaprenyl-phosphate GlcNAc-1-phosphate transferase
LTNDFFSEEALRNLTQHLLPGLWPFIMAAIVCVVAVPFAIVISRRLLVLAQPGGRHAHANVTPLLGGLAMWAGFAIAVAVFLPHDLATLGVLVVSGLATGILIVDDRWSMRPWVKLAVQVGLSLLSVLVFNSQITYVGLPGGHLVHFAAPIAIAVSVFWLVGMQNTVNFLDGADGLAAGVVAIVAVILMLAAGQQKQLEVVQLSGALAGCCVGFLLFNFPPARIFMGDSGAHFLGVALGMISILGVAKVAVAFALAAPVVALAMPIADTGWAILRRRRQRMSVAAPDRLHLHHRLQSFGLNPRQTCYVFYAVSALLGALGLTLFGHGRILAVVLIVAGVLTSTVVADLLQQAGWRIPAPWLRRLLAESSTR